VTDRPYSRYNRADSGVNQLNICIVYVFVYSDKLSCFKNSLDISNNLMIML